MSAAGPLFRLELPATPASAAAVRGALRALVQASPSVRLSSQELDEITVAVQEACTNVIRHACERQIECRFGVEFSLDDDALTVVLRDTGRPFDLVRRAIPEPEELREGGYGTFLIHAWMHEVSLVRHAGENVLTLVRRYGVALPDRESADA